MLMRMETLTFPLVLLTMALVVSITHVVIPSSLHIEEPVRWLLIKQLRLLALVIGRYLHGDICWLRLLLHTFDPI